MSGHLLNGHLKFAEDDRKMTWFYNSRDFLQIQEQYREGLRYHRINNTTSFKFECESPLANSFITSINIILHFLAAAG